MNQPANELTLFPETLWQGDTTLLTWPSAAVLNSRQSRYPVGAEPWVRATIEAATSVARDGAALISGVGLIPWEVGLWAAGEALGGIIILAGVPAGSDSRVVEKQTQQILREYTLSHQAALVIPYEEDTRSPKHQWKARDRWIFERAGRLLPVSIRPGGYFEELLEQNDFSSKADLRFQTTYGPHRHSFPPALKPEAVHSRFADDFWNGWSIHWTRTQRGPWPGERARSFYRDLASSDNSYPRDALMTLKRIVAEKRLRGSGRHMPFQRLMVGFSELHPADALNLMRWRKRYVEPSFEPYGIAVRTEALLKTGARRVCYGSAEEGKRLPVMEKLYFQTVTSDKSDWKSEKEIRLAGDLDLAALRPENVRVIVRTSKEIGTLQELPWPVYSLS